MRRESYVGKSSYTESEIFPLTKSSITEGVNVGLSGAVIFLVITTNKVEERL